MVKERRGARGHELRAVKTHSSLPGCESMQACINIFILSPASISHLLSPFVTQFTWSTLQCIFTYVYVYLSVCAIEAGEGRGSPGGGVKSSRELPPLGYWDPNSKGTGVFNS